MQTNSLRSLFILIVLLVVSACTGLAGEPEIVSTLPVRATSLPAQPETLDEQVNLQTGAVIYAENCVRCHGITGAGDGEFVLNGQVQNVPDFTNPATIQDTSLQEWFDTITNGRLDALMPPWKDTLSAKDRWAVALYTYTLSYTSTSITEGEASYVALCADCHAADGSGTEAGIALQGLVNYSEASLKDTLAAHQTELGLSPALDENNLQSVVEYVRLLSSESQTLPDPNTVVSPSQPSEPAATEDVVNTTPDATAVPIPEALGILRGQVIQGTAGGDSIEGTEAIVHIYDSQLREQIAEYIVGADGTYQYDEVRIRPDFAYRMTAEYKGVTYSSPVVIGDPSETDMVIDVTVYENSADSSAIEITSRATQINLSTQGLYVIEVIDLVNNSDHAYIQNDVAGVPESVSVGFPIPEGAQLQLDHTDPNRIMLNDDNSVVYDIAPVLPNREHYVQFSYLLPIQNANSIQQPIDYTITGPVAFFVEDTHLEFTSDQTTFVETRPFNNQTYSVYQVDNIPGVGDAITYQVALSSDPGTGVAATVQTIPREVLAVILLVAGLVLIGGAAVIILRNRSNSVSYEIVGGDDLTPEDLMKEIAELDNAFESGDLSKSQYQKQRNQLKTQLMQLMKTSADE